MEIMNKEPMVIFDNTCYLCFKFVKMINFFAKGKITIIGHFSSSGVQIKEEVLGKTALDMFWFIDKKTAFGGRAAIIPLIKSILTKKEFNKREFEICRECEQNCKTVKALMKRLYSLFSNSNVIKIQ